ncbi:hypothetical protein ACHQM5_003539 [Ranunculus cassubicifolius]
MVNYCKEQSFQYQVHSIRFQQTNELSEDEEALVDRMFNLVGERWHLIAGRIPGRTPEQIRMYWTSRYSI